jgi:hypothetical protein
MDTLIVVTGVGAVAAGGVCLVLTVLQRLIEGPPAAPAAPADAAGAGYSAPIVALPVGRRQIGAGARRGPAGAEAAADPGTGRRVAA